jgi:hypothetical protein
VAATRRTRETAVTAKEMKFFGNVDGSATSGAVAVRFIAAQALMPRFVHCEEAPPRRL